MNVEIRKIYPYRTAEVRGNKQVLPRELFGDVWEEIPIHERSNHIVVVCRISGRRLHIQFSDTYVAVGDKVKEVRW